MGTECNFSNYNILVTTFSRPRKKYEPLVLYITWKFSICCVVVTLVTMI